MQKDPRYPIGKFDREKPYSRDQLIGAIETLPAEIAASVAGLSDADLDTPYRDGGWTLRQTVHHIADSHMNAYIRFKLALTEDIPTIRPYFEDRWADLPDSETDIDVSLKLIEGLHERWSRLLRSMSDSDYRRELKHPESGRWDLEGLLALYAWHGRHHTAHVTNARAKIGR